MKTNPLSNLVVDYWYKAIVVVSTCCLLLALTVKTYGIDNKTALLLSTGFLFIGIGEWVNHPLQTGLMHHPIHGTGKTTSYNRSPKLTGNLFDILGFLIICIGIKRILF
jgi:hypothetical protein